MILTALSDYYQRIAKHTDAVTGLARVPPYGFSEERISYVLVLSIEGKLVDVQGNFDTSGKKPVAKLTNVPRPEKRTSGIKANFLWDKSAYVLGVEGNKDKATSKDAPWVITQKLFNAFKQRVAEATINTEDAGLKALNLFLQQWQPEQFNETPCIPGMLDYNLIFKLDAEQGFLHDRPAAQALWLKMMEPAEDSIEGSCLVTGDTAPLARLHPAIKGVYGGQSSGGSIVSFNANAYTSYGKEQGENAPVSEAAAFAYTTALNYLLRRENDQCVSIGDASTVFWATSDDEAQTKQAEQIFSWMVNTPSSDDNQESAKLKPILEKIAQGRPLSEIAPNLAANTKFYILGLAPNASRLSIRYWLDTSFGELAEHLTQHFQDLALEPSPWREPPSIWRLLIQTAPLGKSENIPPQLAGEFMRAVITGQRYPSMVLAQLIQRIRADGDINGIRVAVIKAIIQRDFRKGLIQEEISMSLDIDSSNIAYRLGRLFAAIEKIQKSALGDISSTVADKYYGAASAVPFSVFPRLIAGSQNHLTRIRKDKPGYAVNLKKDLAEIMSGLTESFPRHLSIEAQGRFTIGYYHQQQKYFESKPKHNDSSAIDNDESDSI
jgi:CRISPR-associated protein Csd1